MTEPHVFDAADPAGVFTAVPADATEKQVYDGLAEALSTPAAKKPLALLVPKRGKVTLVFDPAFEYELYESWVERAGKGRKDKGPDYLRLSLTVIAHTNIGVKFNGVLAKAPGGEDLTVKHPEFHAMVRAPSGGTAIAIKNLYGSDGHIIQAMKKIVDEAGYSLEGDDMDEEDDNDPLAG